PSRQPQLPAAAIRDLAALRWPHAGQSVILYGPIGMGNTLVAQGPGRLVVRHGADMRFIKTSRAGRSGRWRRRPPDASARWRPDLLAGPVRCMTGAGSVVG